MRPERCHDMEGGQEPKQGRRQLAESLDGLFVSPGFLVFSEVQLDSIDQRCQPGEKRQVRRMLRISF